MTVCKNVFPIMEYSEQKCSIVMPKKTGVKYNKVCVMPFFSECIENFIKNNDSSVVDNYHSEMKDFPIYDVRYKNKLITMVQAPVGAAFAANMLDFIYTHGVEVVLVCGSCGVLDNIASGKVLLPIKALRDEGVSYKYIPPARYVNIDKKILELFKQTLGDNNISFEKVITWTNEALYRETREMVQHRKTEGCQVVEMECSAMAAVAKAKNKLFGQLLYSGDILCENGGYDRRDFFGDFTAREILFYLTMEAAWRCNLDEMTYSRIIDDLDR